MSRSIGPLHKAAGWTDSGDHQCYVRKLKPLPLKVGQNDQQVQITQICSSRRHTAFGILELWDVHLDHLPTDNTLSLISAWFRQSSSTQLSLTMPSDLRYSPLFRSTIIPYAHRFRLLGSFPLDVDKLNSLRFDALSSLSLRFLESKYSPTGHLIMSSLWRVEVTDVIHLENSAFLQHLPQIPWEQLTSLSPKGRLDVFDI